MKKLTIGEIELQLQHINMKKRQDILLRLLPTL